MVLLSSIILDDKLLALWMEGKLSFLVDLTDYSEVSFLEFMIVVWFKLGILFYLSFYDIELQLDIILSTENLFFGSLSFMTLKSLF